VARASFIAQAPVARIFPFLRGSAGLQQIADETARQSAIIRAVGDALGSLALHPSGIRSLKLAGASLLALIDDIATVLDDVAILTKVAARKTAGVLGDDLALNAQQVAGVRADRELPVVWAVAKGSMVNKAILVPAALLISAFAPWAVTPLLMAGGLFLCFEGVEKLAHKFLHSEEDDKAHAAELLNALSDPSVDLVSFEKDKIKGAVRTDFILSAEIIVIALGIVADAEFMTQVSVLVAIAVMMTIGVYGLVAGIVKLDDLGLHLSQRPGNGVIQSLGRGILTMAPYLMKGLSVAGTAAMFLVGGGILAHGIPGLESWLHHVTDGIGAGFELLVSMLFNAGLGIVAGAVVLAAVSLVQRVIKKGDSVGSH
jgi:predicted DNA repair protein MutK